jgi:hypothetical protein
MDVELDCLIDRLQDRLMLITSSLVHIGG